MRGPVAVLDYENTVKSLFFVSH